MAQVSKAMKDSIRYALDHRGEALDYTLSFARDMPRDLADRFVGMYVNHWTLDLGERGKAAVRELLTRGAAKEARTSPPSLSPVNCWRLQAPRGTNKVTECPRRWSSLMRPRKKWALPWFQSETMEWPRKAIFIGSRRFPIRAA
jgi:hypothetical protein